MRRFFVLVAFAVSLVHASAGIPALPSSQSTTLGKPTEKQTGFVSARNGTLYTDDGKPYTFATFNSPHLLSCSEFEAEDTMRTLRGFARPVSRTYVQSVASINVSPQDANIQGWDSITGDWVYNEAAYVQFDKLLDMASKYDVKLVHPIINQDYGDESSNWAGNWADLIRLRYNLSSYEDTKSIDWWTDLTMIDSYKLIVKHLLNRVNTVNGRRYGDDPTFLAFETGNEMNDGGAAPPPGSWTVTAAKYIKSLAPEIMVLDGSLSRNASTEASWAIEALQAPEVDLHSYHYYRDNPPAYDYRRVNTDAAYVRSFGKTYIVGEVQILTLLPDRNQATDAICIPTQHGFYANASEFSDFFQRQRESKTAGSMVWSIRPHADNGGFLTHGEGDGIFSYHAPGWSPAPEPDFDPLEKSVIHLTREASYTLLDEPVPMFPIPVSPVLSVTQVNGTPGFTWQGGAWAEHYELWSLTKDSGKWSLRETRLYDDVDAGALFIPLNTTGKGAFVLRGVSVDGIPGPFSNIETV
ncbi:glycoside hydrolase family 5 protein [Hydnomerulius pinastri MD-312]|uniref:mannan endo-1,4-beta-mannosidase n=1 Tax=Hydnomerulius pinastri MD-312 TaxID=994086 RepID=A0A0C9WEX7_9AGAM|nr:glycoside hydrolase family 5 protein [Hydnomerulius pinastri MD-312]